MGVDYVSVQWNRQKKFYDAVLVGGVAHRPQVDELLYGAVSELSPNPLEFLAHVCITWTRRP